MGEWGIGVFASDDAQDSVLDAIEATDPSVAIIESFRKFLAGAASGYDQSEWADALWGARTVLAICELTRLGTIPRERWPEMTPLSVTSWLESTGFRSSPEAVRLAAASARVLLDSTWIRENKREFREQTLLPVWEELASTADLAGRT